MPSIPLRTASALAVTLLVLCPGSAEHDYHCWDQHSCLAAIDRFETTLIQQDTPSHPHPVHQWVRDGLQALRDIPRQLGPTTEAMLQERRRPKAETPFATPPSTSNYCPNNGPFEFIPINVGSVFLNSSTTLDFKNKDIGYDPCYSSMQARCSVRLGLGLVLG